MVWVGSRTFLRIERRLRRLESLERLFVEKVKAYAPFLTIIPLLKTDFPRFPL